MLNTIKGKKWMWLIMSAMSIGLLWIYTALMPSLASQQEAINELLTSFPKEFLAVFNVDTASMNSFAAVIASKQFDIVWTIMVIALALSLASGNLASEVEKGTMQILLALPLSRKQIYFSKYMGGSIVITSFVMLSILAGIPLAELYDVDYQAVNFYYFTLNGLGFSIFIYSLSFFTSAIASESSKATFTVI
jgi:ABC-2 type transport system permease protein